MAREAKIKGRVETAVDEQSLRRGTDRIREAMDTATDVVPQLDSSRLRRRMERMVPGATTARRGVQTLMDRRGSGDEGGGDSRSGGSGSDDGGSATAGAAGMEIQAEQLEELERIRRILEKDAVSQDDGSGPGGAIMGGLLGAGGTALAMGSGVGGSILGGLGGIGSSIGGAARGIGGSGGILGGFGRGATRGLPFPAPSNLLANEAKKAQRTDEEDRGFIRDRLADLAPSGGPTTMQAMGGDSRIGEVGGAVAAEVLEDELEGLPTLDEILQADSLPNLSDEIGTDLPTLEEMLGDPPDWAEGAADDLEGAAATMEDAGEWVGELPDMAAEAAGSLGWPELPDLSGLDWPALPDLGGQLEWPEAPDWMPGGGSDDDGSSGGDTGGTVNDITVTVQGAFEAASDSAQDYGREFERAVRDVVRTELQGNQ